MSKKILDLGEGQTKNSLPCRLCTYALVFVNISFCSGVFSMWI